LNAVLLGDHQRHLQDIDGVQSQALAIQRSLRIDVLGQGLEIQCPHQQGGNFPL
jgi:hypothetical protein